MPKKNIKDLIKKKQTKKAEEDLESAKKEEEDKINPTSAQNQADQTNKDKESPMPQAKRIDDSDDESEDDAGIQTNSQLYGMITENKDDKEEQTKIEGYGLEDKDQQNTEVKKNTQDTKAPRISKNTASNISFQKGGPMRFSRGPAKAGGTNTKVGDFDVGLDDMDDAGNIKKVKKNTKTEQNSNTNANSGLSGANGGYDFRSLGASAQARGPRRDEEEKQKESSEPKQRPRFTGKLNLKKTGDGDEKVENTGVTTSYGFKVSYKTEHPDGPRKDKKKDGEEATEATGEQPEVRKDRRNVHRDNDKRRGGNRDEEGSPEGNDGDEGFEVVKDKDAARRRARQVNKYSKPEDGSDDEDEDEFTVTKPRATQNRGGAFANMN